MEVARGKSMIKKFVERWEERKTELEDLFKRKHPENYHELVKSVIKILEEDSNFDGPSSEDTRELDFGGCNGLLMYIIPEKGGYPDAFWYLLVRYGSCSGCDTLKQIKNYEDPEFPNEQQVKDYMTLALHVVQGIKVLDSESISMDM